jgi:RNA polymerase sigma-70 factor, ECF subfamily
MSYEPVGGHNPAAWITAIAARQDRAAFAALFEFYAPRIKAMMMRAGASADAGDNLAQEALLAVWRKAAHFDRDRESASIWICAIVRNLKIDRLNQDKLSKLDAVNGMPEADEWERPERRSAPRNAVDASALTARRWSSSRV